jgi:hypothetical protein
MSVLIILYHIFAYNKKKKKKKKPSCEIDLYLGSSFKLTVQIITSKIKRLLWVAIRVVAPFGQNR